MSGYLAGHVRDVGETIGDGPSSVRDALTCWD